MRTERTTSATASPAPQRRNGEPHCPRLEEPMVPGTICPRSSSTLLEAPAPTEINCPYRTKTWSRPTRCWPASTPPSWPRPRSRSQSRSRQRSARRPRTGAGAHRAVPAHVRSRPGPPRGPCQEALAPPQGTVVDHRQRLPVAQPPGRGPRSPSWAWSWALCARPSSSGGPGWSTPARDGGPGAPGPQAREVA